MNHSIDAYYIDTDSLANQLLDHEAWDRARSVQLTRYWSGELAPDARHGEVRALWNRIALFVRFVCRQNEPLVISMEPQIERKTIGLWERDVCEIFIAPNTNEPQRYFEYEAAPTGEWLDLAIHQMTDNRETDWDYVSGMTVASLIEDTSVTIAMRIPFDALGSVPQVGTRWRANLLRCVGTGETRGYMAWQPTLTARPNFHVPEVFGWLEFVE